MVKMGRGIRDSTFLDRSIPPIGKVLEDRVSRGFVSCDIERQ
jgi:hypothetical protein